MIEKIHAIHKTIESTSKILKGMMESGEFMNEDDAFVVLRASLKALRDRITPGEVYHLGSHLPALLRGYYYEGWSDHHTQNKARHRENFLEEIEHYLGGHEDLDLSNCVPVALKTVLEFIDQGEAKDILQSIPKDLRELFGDINPRGQSRL